MELEYRLVAGSRWCVEFRQKPPTARPLLQRLKDSIKGSYSWYRYMRLREDSHLCGYDRWSLDYESFETAKEARDFWVANPDGFTHNAKLESILRDKHEGLS
jgi:hypothetical protein